MATEASIAATTEPEGKGDDAEFVSIAKEEDGASRCLLPASGDGDGDVVVAQRLSDQAVVDLALNMATKAAKAAVNMHAASPVLVLGTVIKPNHVSGDTTAAAVKTNTLPPPPPSAPTKIIVVTSATFDPQDPIATARHQTALSILAGRHETPPAEGTRGHITKTWCEEHVPHMKARMSEVTQSGGFSLTYMCPKVHHDIDTGLLSNALMAHYFTGSVVKIAWVNAPAITPGHCLSVNLYWGPFQWN